jgi:hypothetical protein
MMKPGPLFHAMILAVAVVALQTAIRIVSPASAQSRASDAWVEMKINEMMRDPLGAQVLRMHPEARAFYRQAIREAGAAKDAGGTERDYLLRSGQIGRELQARYVIPALRRASAEQMEKVWQARERFLVHLSGTNPAVCMAELKQELLPEYDPGASWIGPFRQMSQAIATALQDGLVRDVAPAAGDKDAIEKVVARLNLSDRERSVLDGDMPDATPSEICKAQVALGKAVRALPRPERAMVIRELLAPAN